MIRRLMTATALLSVLVVAAGCTSQEEPASESGGAAQSEAFENDALLVKALKMAEARVSGEVCETEAYQSSILAVLNKARPNYEPAKFAKLLQETSGGVIPLALKRNVLIHELAADLKLTRGVRDGKGFARIDGSKGLGAVLRQGISFYGPSAAAIDSELRLNRSSTDNPNEGGLALVVRSWDYEEPGRSVAKNTRIEGSWKLNEPGNTLTVTFTGKCKLKREDVVGDGAPKTTTEQASGEACARLGYKAQSYELKLSEHDAGNGPTLKLEVDGNAGPAAFFSDPSECEI